MKEEVISSGGGGNTNSNTNDPVNATPAASSAGTSSPALPVTGGSLEWLGHGPDSKAGSLSCIGSRAPWTSMSASAGGSAAGSSQPSCRPWERGDLLRRLATFKPANWCGKPKAASSLACARRGWVNVDVDKIECESCSATLKFLSPSSWMPSKADSAGEEFAHQLDEGHARTCPWRGNICPESLVQFPPTPPSALMGGFKDRCDGLLQFYCLPAVSASAIERMRALRGSQIDRFLAQSHVYTAGELGCKAENAARMDLYGEEEFCAYSRAHMLISLCGWESRWLPNVQDYEEHSAQSARDGYSAGPAKDCRHSQDNGWSKKAFSSSARKDSSNNDGLGRDYKCESRSPLLDCGLCGATVRIWDFLTISRPTRLAQNTIYLPETSKKMTITRGASAASGICGWVAADGMEKERTEDLDETATADNRRPLSEAGIDLNLTMAGSSFPTQLNVATTAKQYQNAEIGKDLGIRQPTGSEVGDRAASFESRGPSTRKRSLDEGGSTVDRPQLRIHQADSAEGTIVDRDCDDENDSKQYSAGPSKRPRESDAFEAYQSSYRRDSSGAGPSHSFGFEIETDGRKIDQLAQVNDQAIGMRSTRDSTHVSSIIAMDTVISSDDDSMESVENYPCDVSDVNFPSVPPFPNPDVNETSEINYSNQAQSTCFQPAATGVVGEIGISSTIDGEEVLNADTTTAHAMDGPSIGISGGSVGMGASHEAEIHGTDISVHRADSVVGDVEPVAEVIENQGQTGDFGPDRGLTDNYFPEDMDREDPIGDSQDVVSQSVGKADSGSKIVGSVKAESAESGEKASSMHILPHENSAHPSLSCNAIVCSGYEVSKEEVTQAAKATPTNDSVCFDSGCLVANGIGPSNGESNFGECVEFDPIKHHNSFCPWVNENVAAAGCLVDGPSSSASTAALCGWQLTLDALDAFQSIGSIPIQTVESESAASLCKDDRLTSCQKLFSRHSFIKGRGQN